MQISVLIEHIVKKWLPCWQRMNSSFLSLCVLLPASHLANKEMIVSSNSPARRILQIGVASTHDCSSYNGVLRSAPSAPFCHHEATARSWLLPRSQPWVAAIPKFLTPAGDGATMYISRDDSTSTGRWNGKKVPMYHDSHHASLLNHMPSGPTGDSAPPDRLPRDVSPQSSNVTV